MNAGNLDTTNLLLGIMAAVSVLEALVLIGVGVMAYRLYGQAMRTVRDIEARQITPLVARVDALMTRVDAILADVKDVTARVSDRTERVDAAIPGVVGGEHRARLRGGERRPPRARCSAGGSDRNDEDEREDDPHPHSVGNSSANLIPRTGAASSAGRASGPRRRKSQGDRRH